jgi:hypothetical protein
MNIGGLFAMSIILFYSPSAAIYMYMLLVVELRAFGPHRLEFLARHGRMLLPFLVERLDPPSSLYTHFSSLGML